MITNIDPWLPQSTKRGENQVFAGVGLQQKCNLGDCATVGMGGFCVCFLHFLHLPASRAGILDVPGDLGSPVKGPAGLQTCLKIKKGTPGFLTTPWGLYNCLLPIPAP